MNSLDHQYLGLLTKIRDHGIFEQNRTGIRAKAIVGSMIQHDMAEGFPLLLCKRVPFKSMAVELEGFLKGVTSKKWYQDRGCTIWDEWCNPEKVPYGHDEETKRRMLEEDDLGNIYGSQWRNFHDPDNLGVWDDRCPPSPRNPYDQIRAVIEALRKNPQDRRAICSAWNPLALSSMALPPCHVLWQAMIIDGKLHLTWYQRSVDVPLGLPFNIASYGLLLHLLALELGVYEGTLTGFLNNVHFYENQIEGVDQILSREGILPYHLPTVNTTGFSTVTGWKHSDTELIGYNPLSKIAIPIAV
jgi:thymidylate synthase